VTQYEHDDHSEDREQNNPYDNLDTIVRRWRWRGDGGFMFRAHDGAFILISRQGASLLKL
jgi:hypothetical protein